MIVSRTTLFFPILSSMLAACASSVAPTDAQSYGGSRGCGPPMDGEMNSGVVPCVAVLTTAGTCRNVLISPICVGASLQCPPGSVRRGECTCFDEECEAGTHGDSDATASDGGASDDAASAEGGARDAAFDD